MFVNLRNKRIFEEIVGQVKEAVLSGTLKTGDRLPSEHEWARSYTKLHSKIEQGAQGLANEGVLRVR